MAELGASGTLREEKEVRRGAPFARCASAQTITHACHFGCSSADFLCLLWKWSRILESVSRRHLFSLVDESSESRSGSVSCVCQRVAAGLKKPRRAAWAPVLLLLLLLRLKPTASPLPKSVGERLKKIIMCDLMPASQPPEKMGKMKKLRRTLSESFRSIGEYRFPFSSLLFIKTQKTDVKCLLQQLRPPLPTEMMSAHSLRPWKTHISGLVRVFKHCAPHFEGKLQICQVSELLWGFSSRLSAADQRGSHFSTNGH